jgi:hypothetical protein
MLDLLYHFIMIDSDKMFQDVWNGPVIGKALKGLNIHPADILNFPPSSHKSTFNVFNPVSYGLDGVLDGVLDGLKPK